MTPATGSLCADEPFLRHGLGVGRRAGHAISQLANQTLIPPDQGFKSVVVALQTSLAPGLIVVRHGFFTRYDGAGT
jgi:hypothetical protein